MTGDESTGIPSPRFCGSSPFWPAQTNRTAGTTDSSDRTYASADVLVTRPRAEFIGGRFPTSRAGPLNHIVVQKLNPAPSRRPWGCLRSLGALALGLHGPDPRGCGDAILLGGAAAHPDGPHQLTVEDDRKPAFGGDRPRLVWKGHEGCVAGRELVGKDLRGAAEQRRGARLGLGQERRRALGAVHLLEIDQLAFRPDHRDRHVPTVLLRL